MRVKFTSFITPLDVDLREVALARDLYVIWGLDKVHSLQRAVWNYAGSTARLCAPCDLFPLRVTDCTY